MRSHADWCRSVINLMLQEELVEHAVLTLAAQLLQARDGLHVKLAAVLGSALLEAVLEFLEGQFLDLRPDPLLGPVLDQFKVSLEVAQDLSLGDGGGGLGGNGC